MGDKLPAGGMLHRGGDAHFDTEFVRPVRFALADALDLWRVQGIDFAAALAALLLQHAPGQEQRPYERHLKEHHRMGRNYLAHASGDAINAVLAAAGCNFRRLLAWLRFCCSKF